jgi:hypothetical protein
VFDAQSVDPRANSKPLTIEFPPISATVVKNSYHEADTFQFEADARELPFDPDSIASCAVRIYMWDAEGDEHKQWAIESHEMIRGISDEIEFVGAGDQRISITGRDYTAVLDREWDSKKAIKAGGTLRDAVQSVADEAAPATSSARFLVVWAAKNDNGTLMPEPLCGGSMRSTKKKGMWVKPGKTTWEVIYELVIAHGFIAFVRDSSIIITTPRTQTQASLAQAPRIVYGNNLSELHAKRKLARERAPRIIIVFWDAKQRKRSEVVFPRTAREVDLPIGISLDGTRLKKNEDMRLPAPRGCHDKETALRYAKMRWEMMARAEAEYTIKTDFMKVESATGEVDLMQLIAGDAIAVGFDPFNREHLRALDLGQRLEFIRGMGYSQAVARFVADNVDKLTQFTQPYYVNRATFSFDSSEDGGIDIEINALNYANERREIAWADNDAPDAITGAA